MKQFTKSMIAIFGLALAASAFAANYPMSGQDSTFSYAPGESSITLRSSNGKVLNLIQGHAYRIRNSNSSKSLHLMPGDGTTAEFKINGGFPGGKLDNYTLDGSNLGNPDYDFVMKRGTTSTNLGRSERTESCTYACGQDYICRDVPTQVCRDVREQVCRVVDGRRECHYETRRECDTVYRRECGYETRYCSGTETWEGESVRSVDANRLSILDSRTQQELGAFEAIRGVNTRFNRINLIRSDCR